MREIKFRVWNKTRDEMSKYIESISFGIAGTLNQIDTLEDNILFPDKEAVLMQYTGLKDKNGVEIYEGDIVRMKFHNGMTPEGALDYTFELGSVQWVEECSAFKWFGSDNHPSDARNYWLTQRDDSWREVIGNIYENPELVETKQ